MYIYIYISPHLCVGFLFLLAHSRLLPPPPPPSSPPPSLLLLLCDTQLDLTQLTPHNSNLLHSSHTTSSSYNSSHTKLISHNFIIHNSSHYNSSHYNSPPTIQSDTTHLTTHHTLHSSHTTHLPQLISHNSPPTTHLTHLNSYNSSPTTHIPLPILHHSSFNSSHTTHITQLISHNFILPNSSHTSHLHNSSPTTHLTPQLISHNSCDTTHAHTTPFMQLAGHSNLSEPGQLHNLSHATGRSQHSVPHGCCFCVAGALIFQSASGGCNSWSHLSSRGTHRTLFMRGRCSILESLGICTVVNGLRGTTRTLLRGSCQHLEQPGALPVVNGLRVAGAALREPGRCLWSTVSAGPAHPFAWQVQHLEILGAACGQRSPRGPAHLLAWQVQHLESLGAACGQRSPRDRAPFCLAGAALGATGCCFCMAGAALRESGRCLWPTVSAGPAPPFCLAGAALGAPDATFAWQVQHLEAPGRCLWSTVFAGQRTFLHGRCSTQCTECCSCVAGAALIECLGAACGQRSPQDRAPFCVAGAALRAAWSAACAWQRCSA